jgi:hypothetical protein
MKLASRFALILLIAAFALAVPAAQAQPIDVTKLNMRPLIHLHAEGADIAGRPFQTDVFIHQGGYTLLAYSAETGNARRVARGVATPPDLMLLNQALAAGRVGQQTGRCGGPAPDYVSTYGITWNGKQRVKTFAVGGNYTTCSSEVNRIMDATCRFIWSVLGPSPEICVPPPA